MKNDLKYTNEIRSHSSFMHADLNSVYGPTANSDTIFHPPPPPLTNFGPNNYYKYPHHYSLKYYYEDYVTHQVNNRIEHRTSNCMSDCILQIALPLWCFEDSQYIHYKCSTSLLKNGQVHSRLLNTYADFLSFKIFHGNFFIRRNELNHFFIQHF